MIIWCSGSGVSDVNFGSSVLSCVCFFLVAVVVDVHWRHHRHIKTLAYFVQCKMYFNTTYRWTRMIWVCACDAIAVTAATSFGTVYYIHICTHSLMYFNALFTLTKSRSSNYVLFPHRHRKKLLADKFIHFIYMHIIFDATALICALTEKETGKVRERDPKAKSRNTRWDQWDAWKGTKRMW